MRVSLIKFTGKVRLTLATIALQAVFCSSGWCAESAPIKSSLAAVKLHELHARASELTLGAMELIGIHYKRGGNSPENGLDCSGFVRYVFMNVLGQELPRTSREISKVGDKVAPKDLQPGDLVFYNTLRRGFSHVGIYLGDNKFIHSPSPGGEVRVESMDIGYWKKRFNGARRINEGPTNSDAPPLEAR
jgi:cell wall-associated NlpC family hydrolase